MKKDSKMYNKSNTICIRLDREELESINGSVPNPLFLPEGCYFNPRCKYATDECRTKRPELVEIEPGHKVSCFLAKGRD